MQKKIRKLGWKRHFQEIMTFDTCFFKDMF